MVRQAILLRRPCPRTAPSCHWSSSLQGTGFCFLWWFPKGAGRRHEWDGMTRFSSQLNVSSQEALSEVFWCTDNTDGRISGSGSQNWLYISRWCDLVQQLSLQKKEKQSEGQTTGTGIEETIPH